MMWVKLVGRKVWQAMAIAVPSRLWLGGVISAQPDQHLIAALVEQMRASTLTLVLLVCVDGLSSSIGPCLEVEVGLLIEQVIKLATMTAPERVRKALAYAAWLAHYSLEIDLETVLDAWEQT